MANQYFADIPKGLSVPKQVRVDYKTNIQNENTLKNLGVNNNLAFTYYEGLEIYCKEEKTKYVWREVTGVETGLLPVHFTYPTYPAIDGINYSGKQFNFFLINENQNPADGSETKLTAGQNITITGQGTTLLPYTISAEFENEPTYIESGTNVNITGNGSEIDPYIINSTVNNLGLVKEVNNRVIAPNQSLSLINSDTSGKALVTKEYVDNIVIPIVDGSETKITEGTNILITGNGTISNPYVINSITQENRVFINSTDQINVVGTGTLENPYTFFNLGLDLKANLESPTFTGVVTAPSIIGNLNGNSNTATKLETPITINNVSFDGSTSITITDDSREPRINKQDSLLPDGTGNKFVTVDAVNNGLNAKQPLLISGTNIKTINGNSLLRSGNLDVQDVILATNFTSLPITGQLEKIYITIDDNKIYRFNGTIYVPLGGDVSGKENTSNKQNSLAFDGTGVKFPTVDAVVAGLATKGNTVSLIKETFTFTSNQTFELANIPTNVLTVIVNMSSLHPSQYSIQTPKTLLINDVLNSDDKITIVYNYALTDTQYYTKVETDLKLNQFGTVPFLGSIIPTSTPTGTGKAYWLATQSGIYTNFGGVVVNTNSFAVISRDTNGVFSISQTELDLIGSLSNNSIAPTKLKSSIWEKISINEIMSSSPLNLEGAAGHMMIQSVPLSKVGSIVVSLRVAYSASLKICVVSRSGNNYTIKQSEIVGLASGLNEIFTNLKSEGNLNEYVGIFTNETNLLTYGTFNGTKYIYSDSILSTTNINDTFLATEYSNSTFAIGVSVVSFLSNSAKSEPLIGKTLMTFGDSLTEGDLGLLNGVQAGLTSKPWSVTASNILGTILINKAVSGQNIKAQYDLARTTNFTNVDIVTIMIGTNGGVGSSTLADIQNITDYNQFPDTYYGNYGGMIEYILQQKPSVLIYLMCPPYTSLNRPIGFTEALRTAIKEIGGYYNLPVIDVYGEIGISKKTSQYYLCEDGVHLLQSGYDRLGELMARQLVSR